MSVVEFRPNPQLLRAVRDALAICAAHWPKAMGLAKQQTEDAEQFIGSYARACASCDHELIVEAAHRWCADAEFAPKPVELGKIARSLTTQRRGGAMFASTAVAEQPVVAKNTQRIDELGRWALQRVGRDRLADVWALLWKTATSDAERDAVRNGTLDREVFRLAVQRIQQEAAA